MARSTARKRALNTLYEADEKGQEILSLLSERVDFPGAQTPLPEYAIEIVTGVGHHRPHIDAVINAHSETWRVSRMPVVDRNILRMATWEIVYNNEIPNKVAIDEALQLAKKLSDYDAPSFLHGVLSAISADETIAPEPEEEPSSMENLEESNLADIDIASFVQPGDESTEEATAEYAADANTKTQTAGDISDSIAQATAEPHRNDPANAPQEAESFNSSESD